MFFAVALKYTVCHSIFSFPFLLSLRRLVLQKVGFEIWEYLLRKMGYGRILHSCVRVRPQNTIFIPETLLQLTFTKEASEASMPFQDNLTRVLLQGRCRSILKITSLQNIVPNKLWYWASYMIFWSAVCCWSLSTVVHAVCIVLKYGWVSVWLLSPGPSWRRDSYLMRLPQWAKKWNK